MLIFFLCKILSVVPLTLTYWTWEWTWECAMYAEVQKIFEKYKKVDCEKLYHSFVCAVLDD